jgi:endonuclease/exonuclease/phosphatase (EEP) superfamily protein YafD
MRLVTWNVAGRVRRQADQARAVAAIGADVVALQEVTHGDVLDHVIAQGLDPVASAYADDWRRTGLSDHSALAVDLAH